MPATNSRLAVRLLSGYTGKEVRGQGLASFSQSVTLGHAGGPGLLARHHAPGRLESWTT